MKQTNLFLSFLLLAFTGTAQLHHTDLLEYGFRGNVRTVIKKVYQDPPILNEDLLRYTNGAVSTFTYYFNTSGNIDSIHTVHQAADGEENAFRTIYRFSEGRKTGWTALGEDGQPLLTATITWASGKEFTEWVHYPDGKVKYQASNILNDSFRVGSIRIKEYDTSGAVIWEDTQMFDRDAEQNAISYKALHHTTGSEDITKYEYLRKDDQGNLLKIVMTNQATYSKKLVLMEYIYY